MRETADTSVRAYYQIAQVDLQRAQRHILDSMEVGKLYTRRELEVVADMRTSSVCGRVNALLKAGLLEVVGEKICTESGNRVEALRLVTQQMELALS